MDIDTLLICPNYEKDLVVTFFFEGSLLRVYPRPMIVLILHMPPSTWR